MHSLFFELCVESLRATRAAESGRTDRVELCTQLACGVTPSATLMKSSIGAVSIPVYVLIRPRPAASFFRRRNIQTCGGK